MDVRYSIDQMIANYNKIINEDLSEIFSVIDKLKIEYNKLPEEKVRRHTFLEIIKRGRDENFISYFLAFLLDGKKNGIGNKPLLSLLELVEKGVSQQYRFNNYIVHREWVFANQRRIDVLIVNDDEQIVIGIENKIGTGERENQTKDYETSIYEAFSGYKSILIFLAPYKVKKTTSEKFISINYHKLFDIFSKLQIIDFHEIDSFKFFQDFLLHINYNFINKNEMDKVTFEKALLYAENKKIIEDIKNSYLLIVNQFFVDINEISKNYFDQFLENTWRMNFHTNNEWQQITKTNWFSNDFNIHFEWWFIPNDYFKERNGISFMIDFEGIKDKELISLAKSKENIKKEIEDNGFLFFPPKKRQNGLIYREYQINKPFCKMTEEEKIDFFHSVYDNVRFVIPIVDNLLEEFKNLKK